MFDSSQLQQLALAGHGMLPQTFGTPAPGSGGAVSLTQMLQAATTQQAQQLLGTQLALMEQHRKYEQTQAMLAQASLAAAMMSQQQEEPLQQRVNMEPALAPPPGLHASAPLPTGMTLRLAANGVGMQQNGLREPQMQMVGSGNRQPHASRRMSKREPLTHSRYPPKEAMKTAPTSMLQPYAKEEHNSLRNFLEEDLQNVDKRCVFTARRINKLGFKSKDFLHKHFSKYGEVVEVFVTHPRSKPEFAGAPPKMRPGNFGIVVMKSQEDVQRILALGSEQMVRQIQIRVNMFEAKAEEKAEESSGSNNGKDGSGSGKDGYSSNTGTTTASAFSQGDAGSSGDNPNDENDSDTSQRGMSQQGEAASTQEESGTNSTFACDPQKVTIPSGKNADRPWNHTTETLAKVQRLRQEADAIDLLLSGANQTASLPTSASDVAVVASMLASETAALETRPQIELDSQIESDRFTSYSYTQQPPMPPMPPCDWMQSLMNPQSEKSMKPQASSTPISEPASPDSHCTGTLSSHLMEVSAEDPACVFVARQLHRLGFQSREKLRQHYSQYGKVLRVLVADKRVKAFPGVNTQRKTRPGGLGLILMKNSASVRKILADGQEQYVHGHKILIQPYEGPRTNTLVIDEASSQAASGGCEFPEGDEGKEASAHDTELESPLRLWC
jgi:hypothetical protein